MFSIGHEESGRVVRGTGCCGIRDDQIIWKLHRSWEVVPVQRPGPQAPGAYTDRTGSLALILEMYSSSAPAKYAC
jgi:hypothetical protein